MLKLQKKKYWYILLHFIYYINTFLLYIFHNKVVLIIYSYLKVFKI